MATGLPIGILIGSSNRVYVLLRPPWDFVRSIPPSAVFPMCVLVLGVGTRSKIATTAITATLIYALGVADAAKVASRARRPFCELIGMRTRDWLTRVLLPSAFVNSASSLRVVTSITVAMMIVCEMFLGEVDGFGGIIINFHYAFRYGKLVGAIVIAGLMGLCFNRFLDAFVPSTSDGERTSTLSEG